MSKYNSIENVNLIYYQKKQDVILNKAKDYYASDKERWREQARDKFRYLNMSEKKKKKTKRMSKKLSWSKKI